MYSIHRDCKSFSETMEEVVKMCSKKFTIRKLFFAAKIYPPKYLIKNIRSKKKVLVEKHISAPNTTTRSASFAFRLLSSRDSHVGRASESRDQRLQACRHTQKLSIRSA